MDDAGTVVRGDLLVRDGRIAALGAGVPAALAALPGGSPDERFDAGHALVIPGLIQGHVHLCQTLFRGLAEQSDLLAWLRERIWPLEAAHTPASLAASARLGLTELLAAGVTCVNDMGTVRHTEALGETLEASGVRAVFGKALMDQGEGVPGTLRDDPQAAVAESLALARRFGGAGGGRLAVALAPRFVLSCSDRLWEAVAEAARSHGLRVHTHLAESPSEAREVSRTLGTTAARHLARHQALGAGTVAAHGVWLDPEEIALVAGADAALVHCPASNLKLGCGMASVRSWIGAGIRRGLGSDAAACSNRLDPFHDMSLAALVGRARHPERALVPREVLALATCEGARALRLEDEIGSLAPGKQADVTVVDVSGPHHGPEPFADPYVTMVHAARAADVRLTMVAGRVLYRDGRWTTFDPREVVAEARAEVQGVTRRAA